VVDAPYEYEDRIKQILKPRLRHLGVFVPEIHDLILMKIVRGYEVDLETMVELAGKRRVRYETLLARFQREMTHTVGDPKRLRLNFLAAIERIFGEKSRGQS